MKRILSAMLALVPIIAVAQVEVTSLRVNRLDTPMGIDPDEPVELSWIVKSVDKNASQSAYEVRVMRSGMPVWFSGVVQSSESISVPCGVKLHPDSYYTFTVRVWDNKGRVSEKVKSWYTTGLRKSDWSADWIGENGKCRPINLRGKATLDKKIKRATAYITSHGQYEAYINGKRVGDAYMTPGWTSYRTRVQYQAYDVTALLQRGENVLAAMVAPGWYSGMGYRTRKSYGDDISLLMQVNVEYTNGEKVVLSSDKSWKMSATAKASGVVSNDIYHGETIDARLVDKSWTTTAYNEGAEWGAAEIVSQDKSAVVSTLNELCRAQKPIKPVKYILTPKGEKVIDFGQNIVGWERVKLQGKAGDTIRIYHAETLDENGNFYTVNLRTAKATSTYIMDGEKREFAPTVTFYGFRYIRIEGLEGEPNLDDYEIVPVWSDFDNVGTFSSSNPLVNQLQSNIWWGFHDNFLDVPTDCPQRNERLGWTGDAQVFFRTASFLGRVENFFEKWLADLRTDQFDDGTIPRIIPNAYMESTRNRRRTAACGWADAATIVPWKHYMAYGDKAILANQYQSMTSWVNFLIKNSKDQNYLWTGHENDHYGDWLFYSVDNDRDGVSAVTSKRLLAQCFFIHSLDNVVKAAEVLGKVADIAYYKDIAEKARKAYQNEYVTPNGLVSSDTQTAYVLALHFDLLPEGMRAQAAKRLVENIKRYKNHISTGFLGTPYICEVLTRFGYTDMAYTLLLQEGCPGWLYQVKMGATTVWERWDSIRKDGSIPDNGMNSLNHYAYGSIGDWLYREAVGIKEAAPGYKRIAIKPHTGGKFENMEASTVTPYGKVAAAWKAKENILKELSVEIPFNTTAEVYVPASNIDSVKCDDATLKAAGYADGYVKFALGSGKYTFVVE